MTARCFSRLARARNCFGGVEDDDWKTRDGAEETTNEMVPNVMMKSACGDASQDVLPYKQTGYKLRYLQRDPFPSNPARATTSSSKLCGLLFVVSTE